MYLVAPGKLSSGTRPPCFWNCGTAAGLVLNTRHGALPAVMAAPMTSSEVLPAGISWAVTFSFGCAEFHCPTIALPQAISSGLFESQTLIGPVEDWAWLEPPPPPPQAAVMPRARTAAETGRILDLMGDAPFVRVGGWTTLMWWVRVRSTHARRAARRGDRPGWVGDRCSVRAAEWPPRVPRRRRQC